MELASLEIFWYIIIILALIMFSVLDGFDLGVGMIHPFAKTDDERRIFLNAIGPVWDGNAVWLIIVSGGLFAGFPPVFATVFSSFYDLMMIILCGIIFRAVAIEFRSKQASRVWRAIWDYLFFLGSLITAFFVGLLLGNLVIGIPLDHLGDYHGDFVGFFNTYTIIFAITTAFLFIMHGSIFLLLKTEGAIHDRLRGLVKFCIFAFIAWYIVLSVFTVIDMPHMVATMLDKPWLFIFPILGLLLILNIPREVFRGNDGRSFLSSSLSIVMLFILYALGTFPILVRSTLDPINNSLTIYNSSASITTLFVLMIIVIIGVPLVLGYTAYIYHVFRHKVKLTDMSY